MRRRLVSGRQIDEQLTTGAGRQPYIHPVLVDRVPCDRRLKAGMSAPQLNGSTSFASAISNPNIGWAETIWPTSLETPPGPSSLPRAATSAASSTSEVIFACPADRHHRKPDFQSEPVRVTSVLYSYERVGKRALISHQRLHPAQQFMPANRALQTLRTHPGRVTRDIVRSPQTVPPQDLLRQGQNVWASAVRRSFPPHHRQVMPLHCS